MSFLFSNSGSLDRRALPGADAKPLATADRPPADVDRYADLMSRRPALLDEKLKLHGRIIDEFNLALLEKLSPEELRRDIQAYVAKYIRAERISLNQKELETFTAEVLAEMIGFGPIEPLLKDPTVSDILINTHNLCFVERFGKLERANVRFKDEAHLLRIINKIVSGIGRRVDELSPMVDARLPDGSRVNVAIRPVSVDGPLVSIRKFAEKPYQHRAPDRDWHSLSADGRPSQSSSPRPHIAHHLRWDGNRKDHTVKCPLELHPKRRASDYH